jgi:glucokinase
MAAKTTSMQMYQTSMCPLTRKCMANCDNCRTLESKRMSETYSIGVDLGGTNLRIAAYSGGVDFLESILLPTHLADGPDRVVRDMSEGIEVLRANHGSRRLVGIGIGSPGPMELPEGTLHNPPNLPGWDGFQLRRAIESAVGMPVQVESDANLAALAEQKLGAGKTHGINSLCVLTLGTGVGSGLILNGRIWHGVTGMGGEAGHIIVQDIGGARCGCGGYGCLEQYASAPGILRMARERTPEAVPASAHDLALLARAGDPGAVSVFEAVGHALAIAFTSLVNTLNLPMYLLGGGVSEAWDLLAPVMFRDLRQRSYIYRLTRPEILEPSLLERNKTYILGARLGPTAGLLGACLLPYQPKELAQVVAEDLLVHQ